jgi:hypothetical protein
MKNKTTLFSFLFRVVILAIIGCACVNVTYAQLSLNVNMNPNPTPKIVEWASKPETVTVTIQNSASRSVDYQINVEILKDGKTIARSKLFETPSYAIEGLMIDIKFAEDVVPYESLDIVDNTLKNTIAKTGKMQAGNYQLCLQLVDPTNTNTLLSQRVCRPFYITEYEIPRLIIPLDKAELLTENGLNFQWTPITPYYKGNVTYVLRICEVYDDQTSQNAFNYNQPILDEEIINQTTYFLLPDKNFLEQGKTYTWGVRAVDSESEEIINEEKGQNGWTTQHVFTIGGSQNRGQEDDTTSVTKKLQKDGDNGGGYGTKKKGTDDTPTKKIAKDILSKPILSKKDCGCTTELGSAELPEVKILYPDNPYTRSIIGLGPYLTHILLCDTNHNDLTKYSISGSINWGETLTDDVATPGPAIYEKNYDSLKIAMGLQEIPTEICIEIKVKKQTLGAYKGYGQRQITEYETICTKTVCLDVPNPTHPKPSEDSLYCELVNINVIHSMVGDSAIHATDNTFPAPESEVIISNKKWILSDGYTIPDTDTLTHTFKETKVHEVCREVTIKYEGSIDSLVCRSCMDVETGVDCDGEQNFTYSIDDGVVTLQDSSFAEMGGEIVSVKWEINETDYLFGDSIDYTFVSKGTYNICQTVTFEDLGGGLCDRTICKSITISSGCDCEVVGIDDVTTSATVFTTGSTIGLANGLSMELTSPPTGGNANLSGEGTVYIPWILKTIDVEFSSVKINGADQLGVGKITAQKYATAPDYPVAWGVNLDPGFTMDSTLIQDIYDFATYLVSPKKVPLAISNTNGNELIFTNFKFEPSGNKFSAIAKADFDIGSNKSFGLEGRDISFTDGGPSMVCGGSFEIAEPIVFNYSTGEADEKNWFAVTLNKSGEENIGTGVEWTSTCGQDLEWCFKLDIDFELPRKWLRPVPDDGTTKVATNVQTEICDWNDWLVELNLPQSEINGLNGTELKITSMTYDHSLVRNPLDMAFPANFDGDDDVTFKGFWLKQAKVILPEGLSTYEDPTQRVEVQLNNWIINKSSGITGQALAANIINLPKANIADLGASIDTLQISFLNSTAENAYIKGKIILPFSDSTSSNALLYTGLFGGEDTSGIKGFKFTLEPEGNIKARLFAGSSMEIYPSSNMNIILGKDSTHGDSANARFDLHVTGKIMMPDSIKNPINDKMIAIKFHTTFEDMGFSYSKLEKDFDFDLGIWDLASPQKELSKFPITLEEFKPITISPSGTEVLRGGFSVDIVVNLAKDKIGGRTTLAFIGAIEKNPGEKLSPSFKEINIEKIDLFANLAAVKMTGSIDFIQDDPMWGDGVKGEIDCKFNSIDMDISASAFFGNTTYGAPELYRYWKVEAMAILAAPGIPFMTGVNFRGFGVGAYGNMSLTYASDKLDVAAPPAETSTFSGATFTPDHTVKFGFKVKAVVATTPKEESFNADMGLSGEFAEAGGMTFIRFDGDFFVGSKISERHIAGKAFIFGGVFAEYDFVEKVFDMGAYVNINKAPISTPSGPASLALHIDKPNNLWYFRAGTPSSPNIVSVLGTSIGSYVQFGNQIEVPSGFMDATRDGYFAATGVSLPFSISPSAVNNTTTQMGKGFAFGIGINLSKDYEIKITKKYYGYAEMDAGAEINLSMMEYVGACDEYDPFGLNGWYCKGNLAAYIAAGAGVRKKKDGAVVKTWVLAEAGIGAWLSGSFPKPVYMAGGLDIHYELIGGLADGDFHADFVYGIPCYNGTNMGATDFDQGDAAQDQANAMIVNLTPTGNNIDVGKVITAAYGFTPDEVFEASEQQVDGSVKVRTFKVEYTTKLEAKIGGVYTPQSHQFVEINALGEYVYIKNPPMGELDAELDGIDLGEPADGGLGEAPGGIAKPGGIGMAKAKLGKVGIVKPGGLGVIMIAPMGIDDPFDDGDLPPPPPGTKNNLDEDVTYKFTVNAVLYEYVGGLWVNAKNNAATNITQEKFTTFRTGPMEVMVMDGDGIKK